MFDFTVLILLMGKIILKEVLIAQSLISPLLVQLRSKKSTLSISDACVLTATSYLFLYYSYANFQFH